MDVDLRKQCEALLQLLVDEGVRDPRVVEAIARVPREQFVPDEMRQYAYHNSPLPIGWGQTISQPLVVAAMIEALQVDPSHRVLEIGTGLGYQAAVLAQLAAEVFTVERLETLAFSAVGRLHEANYRNVQVRCGDGSQGWLEHSPYDGIIVAAAGREIPQPLLDQLRVGGRLVLPLEQSEGNQHLFYVTRTAPDEFDHKDLGRVQFVPLVTG